MGTGWVSSHGAYGGPKAHSPAPLTWRQDTPGAGEADAAPTPGCQRRVRGEGAAAAPSLRKVHQPPRPSLPHGAKPTSLPHTQTIPSARRPHHTTSAAAGSCALTPPSPRRPFPARWWHTAVAAAVAEEKRLRFPSRPGPAEQHRRSHTRGRTRTSRPPEGQQGRPPLPRWRRLRCPLTPRVAARGAGAGGAFPPRPALCPAGRARRRGGICTALPSAYRGLALGSVLVFLREYRQSSGEDCP